MAVARYSSPSQCEINFYWETPDITKDFPGSIFLTQSWVKSKTQSLLIPSHLESSECEKCPDCDAVSLLAWVCGECGYSENPNYELPEDFYQTKKAKTIAKKNAQNFLSHGVCVYSYEIDQETQKISHLFVRYQSKTYQIHIQEYSIISTKEFSRFSDDEGNIVSKIAFPVWAMTYQFWNKNRTLWPIYQKYHKDFYTSTLEFLQHFHQAH